MNRIYAVVDAIAFQEAVTGGCVSVENMFTKVIETDLSTLRYNIYDTKFIIKCEEEEDIVYLRNKAAECDIPYVEYTHAEILQEVAKPEWNKEDPELCSSSSSSSSGD